MAENNFTVITAGQVWPEYVIITVVIASGVRNDTMMNALIQMSLYLENKQKLSYAQRLISIQKRMLSTNFDLIVNLMKDCAVETSEV